jgi:hypothetical protein
MLIAIWLFTLVLVGLGALLAWALTSLIGMPGDWPAQAGPWLAQMPLAAWLESWFPQWLQVTQAALQAAQALFQWLGQVGPLLIWLAWGAVTVVMVLLAAILSLVVVLIQKSQPPSSPPPSSPSGPVPTVQA